MANVYVRSGAGGAANGTTKTDAYLTLAAAFNAGGAGNDFFVASDHAETQASAMTLTSPGTAAAPCRVLCVDFAGSTPPVSADLRTTATITTTGANNITMAGIVSLCYGIIFSFGDGVSSANVQCGAWYYKNCALQNSGNSGGGVIRLNGAPTRCVWDNTTCQFANAAQTLFIPAGTQLVWKNTPSAITGATLPTSLFGTTSQGTAFLEGVDLTALSGKTLHAAGSTNNNVLLKDCKIPASFTRVATLTSPVGPEVVLTRCDSGATNYQTEKYEYTGSQVIETTIVRTGGASDGTTPISWKIDTTTGAKPDMPFTSLPIAIWNDTIGSVTVTVFGIWGGGAVPNNDDIWMEGVYLDDSGSPLGSFISTGKADTLAANAALATDSSTWGGSTTKFKMEFTVTPALKGTLYLRIKAGAASATFYVDPKPVLS